MSVLLSLFRPQLRSMTHAGSASMKARSRVAGSRSKMSCVFNASVAVHGPPHPAHVAAAALAPRLAEHGREAPPLRLGALLEQVNEHHRALALGDVAAQLLAVLAGVADQIQ
jgi:hypothetical protein